VEGYIFTTERTRCGVVVVVGVSLGFICIDPPDTEGRSAKVVGRVHPLLSGGGGGGGVLVVTVLSRGGGAKVCNDGEPQKLTRGHGLVEVGD